MNKQELIEEWSSKTRAPEPIIIRESFNYADSVLGIYEQGFLDARTEILRDLEQLDEPRKPVVPQFVADYIEEYRGGGATLYEMMDSSEDEVYTWLFGNPRIETENERQLLFAQAYVVGYEVEKEQLYVMPVPHVSFSVHYCVEDDHISFRQGNAQKFTQAELDRYFPDIKQFAVPVDEVVEG